MMTARYVIIFFLISLAIATKAQSNYKEGNVVTNSGTMIKGFINYREWHKNPEQIQFKSDLENGKVQTLTVDSIAKFTITGYESYDKYIVPISMNEISFESLKEVMDTSSITIAVFLKKILTGDHIDLYSYTDVIKVRFYVLDKRQTLPYELIYRKSLSEGREINQPLFRQQLSELALTYGVSDASLEERISRAIYSGKDIRNVISKINTINETIISVGSRKNRKQALFLSAGITGSSMNYTGKSLIMSDGLDDMGEFKFKNKIITHSYLPRVSAGVDFYINPAIRRLIIRAEISASNIKSTVTSYYKFNIYSSDETENIYRFSSWNIGLSPQLIFKLYSWNKHKWYAGSGFLLNYIAKTDNSLERKDRKTGQFIDKAEDYLKINKFAMNAIVRSGLLVNDRLDLSLIWTSPSEYTNYIVGGQSIKTTLFSFSAAYYLKK